GAVERRAVVVDGHGAVDDLVAAVGVDVGDGQLVVALAGVLRPVVGRQEVPAPGEVLPVPVPGGGLGPGVDAAGGAPTRGLSVEVGHGGQERSEERRVGTGG